MATEAVGATVVAAEAATVVAAEAAMVVAVDMVELDGESN